MTTTKIKIDLAQGIIEAEGTEEFVSSIYTDYKDALKQSDHPPAPKLPKGHAGKATKVTSHVQPANDSHARKKKVSGGKGTPSIVKDLNLAGGGKKKRLKDFYNQFSTNSNFERNLIFVYYLQHELEIPAITVDHVFTCYRDVQVKAPEALRQSLLDTSNRKGWLDTSSTDEINVTVPGMNYLEHDMPKASPQ